MKESAQGVKWPRGRAKGKSHSTTRPLDHSTTFLIGVGGNAGAGKSTLVRELARLGARVIDADRIGWELLEKGTPVARRVVRAFGADILDSGGSIDRKRLGAIVFVRPAARRRLNRIVHPVLLREIQRQAGKRPPTPDPGSLTPVIVIDAALLFDWNWHRNVHLAVLVSSTRRNKFARLTASGLTRTAALNRLASQLPESEMRRKADIVIPNNGTVTELKVRARRFYRLLQAEMHALPESRPTKRSGHRVNWPGGLVKGKSTRPLDHFLCS